ncbi:hypothetical protein CP967_07235 [Streptomyces nitrosporeus]|uniref:Uncharacterized protein n=1 Tax=Streptomyces nitrosporeus TaxID=28894 RepID=A0A5J6F6K3_9ACTN|nr:hypothetical protein CP967_07235 [Streptomyces nitrosporeus]
MTTRCPFSDPQDPVSRVSNIRDQGPVASPGRWRQPARELNRLLCGPGSNGRLQAGSVVARAPARPRWWTPGRPASCVLPLV